MPEYADHFGAHLNRRGQDEAGRRRNIQDGIRAEQALADALIEAGVDFRCPGKPGSSAASDAGDFVVQLPGIGPEVWSVKASRMWMAIVCGEQKQQPADRYAFYAVDDRHDSPHHVRPLGIIANDMFYRQARFVPKGSEINPGGKRVFQAHYDLYVIDQAHLSPIETVVQHIARGEAA